MSWINLLGNVFFAVLVTSAAGNIMFLFWFLCRKILPDLSPKSVYYMLKWVVIMYLLPIAYMCVVGNHKIGYVHDMGKASQMVFVINLDNKWFQILTLVWFVSTICVFVFFLKNELCKYRICRNNFDDCNTSDQKEFERIKNTLGIKGNVTLLRNDSERQKTPFVIGIWNRKVVLPYVKYTEEELKVILYHELNHIKKRDIIFRYLTIFAIILNSINPISYLLWERIQLWTEADCDARTIDALEKEGFSMRQYYAVIWNLNELHSERVYFSYPMLMSAVETFYRRILIMKKYHTDKRCMLKIAVHVWIIICALVSTATAHAAGIQFAEMNDDVLQETQIVYKMEKDSCLDNWSDEMLLDTETEQEIICMSNVSDDGMALLEWSIPVDTRYITDAVYMPKGAKVQMAYVVEQEHCLYRLGLMNADGKCVGIEGTGMANHSFGIQEDGYYRIIIENCADSILDIWGCYQYEYSLK